MQAEERLERLETRLAQMDDEIQSLNLALFRQGQELEQMRLAQKQLLDWLKAMKEQAPAAVQGRPEDEIPPHY